MTAINNPQKLNPACYLSINEHRIDGQLVLCIFVPESSQVHRCNGRVFDRNEDGDIFRTRIGYPDMTSYPIDPRPELRPESGLATEILNVLKSGPLSKNEVAGIFKHQSISGGLKKQIKQLLILGLIEMTLPEKPNSRLQKYRLKKQ